MSNDRITRALEALRSATRRLQRNDHRDPHITLANLAFAIAAVHVADEELMAEYEGTLGVIQTVLDKHRAEAPRHDPA